MIKTIRLFALHQRLLTLVAMTYPNDHACEPPLITMHKGLPLLREEVASLYGSVKADGVLIGAPQELILIGVAALIEPGDHVVCTWPGCVLSRFAPSNCIRVHFQSYLCHFAGT